MPWLKFPFFYFDIQKIKSTLATFFFNTGNLEVKQDASVLRMSSHLSSEWDLGRSACRPVRGAITK